MAVAALVGAALLGLGAGVAPGPTAAVTAALVSAVVLLPRLEWAALAVVCASVFADWLALLSPYATAWLTALLLLAWGVRRAAGPLHARCPAWVLLPSGVLAAVLVVATVVHGVSVAGLEAAAAYAVPLAVLVVLVDCLCGPLAPRRAARAYVLACTLAALGAVVTAVAGSAHRVSGPLARPDELALFLLAAVPLAPTLAGRRSGSRSVWSRSPRQDAVLVTAVVALLLVALLGTRSRPALVALLVVVAVAVATRTLSVPRGGVFALLVAAGAAAVLVVLPRLLGSAIAEAQHDSDVGLGARLERWRSTLELTAQAPVLGLGPGTDAGAGLGDGAGAHSTVLQASSELGVVGAVALLAVFVVPLLGARRRWRRDRSRLTAAIGLSLTGLLALSLVQTVHFALPLWLLAALAAAQGQRNRGRLTVPDGPAVLAVPVGGARGRG